MFRDCVLGDTEVLCYKKQAAALRVFVFVSRPVNATSNEDLSNDLLAWRSRVDLDSPSLHVLVPSGSLADLYLSGLPDY